jgi:hypothetical protein
MAEQGHPEPAPAVLNVNDEIMKNHMITFLLQYIAAVQNIKDRRQLIYELMHAWEKKFYQSIDRVKKAASRTYAEKLDEDEDVWDIITDINNMHVEGLTRDFAEKMTNMLLENLKLS